MEEMLDGEAARYLEELSGERFQAQCLICGEFSPSELRIWSYSKADPGGEVEDYSIYYEEWGACPPRQKICQRCEGHRFALSMDIPWDAFHSGWPEGKLQCLKCGIHRTPEFFNDKSASKLQQNGVCFYCEASLPDWWPIHPGWSFNYARKLLEDGG